MCSVFEFGKRKVGECVVDEMDGILEVLREVEETRLIRRTDVAPVMKADGEVAEMRWGVVRDGLGPVSNARSERLGIPMWREAFAERRCLIPVAHFYEWSGPKGRKLTHKFSDPQGGWLWMAGMWEASREHGECFTMLTTSANGLMAPIHDRMPVVLSDQEIGRYLRGELGEYSPADDCLVVGDAENPLVKRRDDGQGELF